jgi:hypothetical protein
MLIGLIILLVVVVVVDKLLQQVLVEMTCGTTAAEKAGVVFIDEAERSSTLAEKHEEGNVNVIALFCRSVPFLIRSARMRESGDVVVCLCVKSMRIVLFLWHSSLFHPSRPQRQSSSSYSLEVHHKLFLLCSFFVLWIERQIDSLPTS